MSVKSVYNFVPAPKEDEVFKPDWADQVSHDLPFSDGESGEIELKITAETPIFIRNGHAQGKETAEFSHYVNSKGEKQYFIPGPSLKGMFRNVLEIISNSKLSQLNNHRHAVRQIIKNKDDVMDEGYELSKDEVKKKIKCGYLIRHGEKYYIHSCGKPLKIRYTDIDNKYHKNFEGLFGASDNANIKEDFDHRTASYKYDILSGIDLGDTFEIHPLDENDKQKSWVSKFQPLRYARFAENVLDKSETFAGRVVLVGQASNYDVSTARKGEYVFRGEKSEILKNNSNRLEVSETQMEDFKFINRDGKGESHELKDWAFWKDKIDKGIPVFYREKEIKGKREIVDFGLPFSYKQPAEYRVKQLLPNYPRDKDLAETIFGSIEENGLKGRVFVGNAWCSDENPKEEDEVTVTLSSPKSSFTPFYIKQKGSNGKTTKFDTYNTNGKLRGYKRYPVHNDVKPHPGESSKMQSHFIPLRKGTVFCAKARFHNLRPLEIGALLNAITLNNTDDTYHNIGYAKPLGYGKVKIDNVKLKGLAERIDFYTKQFQVEMSARYGQRWISRINELLSMSINPNMAVEDNLVYEALKEFQEIKNKGAYLQGYSDYGMNFNYNPDFGDKVEHRIAEIEKAKQERRKEVDTLNDTITQLEQQERYGEAIEKLKKLASLKKVENFESRIQELKRQEKINNVYLTIKKTDDIDAMEDFIEKNPLNKNVPTLRKRVQQLRIKKKKRNAEKLQNEITLNFKDSKYKSTQEVVKKPYKNNKYLEYNEKSKDEIENQLRKCWEADDIHFYKKRKKNKGLARFTEFPWSSDIKTWLGEERAKALYDELTKDHQ